MEHWYFAMELTAVQAEQGVLGRPYCACPLAGYVLPQQVGLHLACAVQFVPDFLRVMAMSCMACAVHFGLTS